MVSKLTAAPVTVESQAFTPMTLGPLTLKNRFIKAATFEGRMPRGEVTDDLIDFHTEVADGGVAMTTVAYCAVSPGGRVHRDTMVLDQRRAKALRRLTDAVHARDTLVCAQIGHAGLVANTRSNRMRTLAPSTRLSAPAIALVRGATAAAPPRATPSTRASTPSRFTSAMDTCSARSSARTSTSARTPSAATRRAEQNSRAG
jgi:2,4-dienoyl-CoA reductase-like NADH-dependent reductase (Old Yellow Enzyme family)